ncbi:MAG: hypothetical protein B7Y39_12425 [Bdellovibrio sp. 28-41-41]|nr:MAG: hypothetical protein B7Y39_12425 [Bdellovibrio sp. 28-41-41]
MKFFSLILMLVSVSALAENVTCEIYLKDGYTNTEWKKWDAISIALNPDDSFVWRQPVGPGMDDHYFVGVRKSQLVIESERVDIIDKTLIRKNKIGCYNTAPNVASCEDDRVKIRCTK